jgi:hypothetical protein
VTEDIDDRREEKKKMEEQEKDKNKLRSEDERHDQGQLRNVQRVDTVNLERGREPANPQAASSGSGVSTSADEFEVKKKLYDSCWFWIWLWFWILALFIGTTYGATQGIVF